MSYPDYENADILLNGFQFGFPIFYSGPRTPVDCANLKSVYQNPETTFTKLQSEIDLGRIAGPFRRRPISNLRCSPIGVIPKKTGGLRLITHLSYPLGFGINSYIDPVYSSVQYSPFDNAVAIVQRLGKGALCGKCDIKSAFRLLPIYPGCFDLLGIKFNGNYYIDKMLPMGLSQSCSYFEKFSTFIEWVVKSESDNNNIDHYLDDFFFAGKKGSDDCEIIMDTFFKVCDRLNVPVAAEKTVRPSTIIEYLGLTIDTENMIVRIPLDKIVELKQKISFVLGNKKVTLKSLQSLTGSLAFCTKALPAGRAFSRRLYAAMSKANKPHHFIRVSNSMKSDLLVWKEFLDNFNGLTYIHDINWISSSDLELYTDSAGGETLGCGAFFAGKWTFLQWPNEWTNTAILRDITYLEIIPIALAIYLWGHMFANKKVVFFSDNEAVVYILNNKTSKSENVMSLLRFIVYATLRLNILVKSKHIISADNKIADYISRGQVKRFKELVPFAEPLPCTIPSEFWNLLCQKRINY